MLTDTPPQSCSAAEDAMPELEEEHEAGTADDMAEVLTSSLEVPAETAEVEVSAVVAADDATDVEMETVDDVHEDEGVEQPAAPSITFGEGDDVKVFSSSADEWVFGIIDQVNYDAAEAEVRYEVDGEDRTKWVDCSEGSTEIKDANEEEAAEESIVVGATRTRSGRDAKRIIYDESDGEDDEKSFALDDESAVASSDEEFEDAQEEEAAVEDLSKLTVAELKVRLKAVGGTVRGRRLTWWSG